MKPTVWHANDSYSYHPRRKRQQRIDIMEWAKNVELLPDLAERDERDDVNVIGGVIVAVIIGLAMWACAIIGWLAALGWLQAH